MKVLSLQQLRRTIQSDEKKSFVFESETQPDYTPQSTMRIYLVCWFGEIWPQANKIIMRSNCGDICFCNVRYVVRQSDSPIGETVYTIHCGGDDGPERPTVYRLAEYV